MHGKYVIAAKQDYVITAMRIWYGDFFATAMWRHSRKDLY